MNIRLAEEKDIDSVIKLLTQVLNIHAKIRPDIFIGGTTKYTKEELMEIFNDANRPVYVAVDENDSVMGYAFCIKKKQPFSTNMVPFDSLFIDDLCVDQNIRGKHVGQKIFELVKEEAKKMGCYEVTLTFGKATIQPADFMKNGYGSKRNTDGIYFKIEN